MKRENLLVVPRNYASETILDTAKRVLDTRQPLDSP
jgi:hypothetical protein